MQLGKKATVLSAVAGALVLAGSGSASAQGLGDLFGGHGGSSQSNECSTSTGSVLNTATTAQTGDLEFSSNCINYDETGRAHQSNACDTATGTTALTDLLAPTGEIETSSNCANIAVGHGWH
ncbi:hypothetical protein [Kitasatospora camelliae]|uniref:Secreted protein n=1 Tax=Kitasatospora camelliae TaxID=3156397 RepID=A0AAU8JV66_9ACTN